MLVTRMSIAMNQLCNKILVSNTNTFSSPPLFFLNKTKKYISCLFPFLSHNVSYIFQYSYNKTSILFVKIYTEIYS